MTSSSISKYKFRSLHTLLQALTSEQIAKNAIAWPAEGLRRASVSSFGFGGTNAHIVLDDAFNYLKSRNLTGTHNTVENPVLQQSDDTSDPDASPTAMGASKLLVWSSWDEKGIERLQEAWKPFLSRIVPAHKPAILHDLAHTLASRRTHHPWKTFAVAGPSDDLTSLADRFAPAQRSLNSPNMAFVFSGVGNHPRSSFCSMLTFTKCSKGLSGLQWVGSCLALLRYFYKASNQLPLICAP